MLWLLHQAGYEVFIVGGAVRDVLRLTPTEVNPSLSHLIDFDCATNAKPEEIMAVFPNSYYENEFGTVSLTYEHLYDQLAIPEEYRQAKKLLLQQSQSSPQTRLIDIKNATKVHVSLANSAETVSSPKVTYPPLEITTYRTEEKYENGPRKPSSLSWGSTLSEDLSRRDFTINALAIDLHDVVFSRLKKAIETQQLTLNGFVIPPEEYDVIDEHGGWHDLHVKCIKTVGPPTARFAEDALRMLRAIRLSVQLGFDIEIQTHKAITLLSHQIQHVSAERIRVELCKMLVSPEPKRAIELLDSCGLLPYILPELEAMKGVEQSGHHTTEVWTHSLDALQACPSSDPVVRLATLLHDVAKPLTFARQTDSITFYNHEVIGARMARDVGRRLKFSSKDCDRLFTLVRYHMFHYQPENTDAAIRRFMRKVGLENIDDILDLREGDRLGSGARKTSWRLEEMKQRMIEQLNQPFDLSDLAIDGTDVMRELNLPPGPQIGLILKDLQEKVLAGEVENTKEALLEQVKLA